MKIIYKIAAIELRMLFCSPIAWLLLLCFVLQTGIIFTGTFDHYVVMTAKGNPIYSASALFTGGQGLWGKMQEFIYMYIPLLTMGVVSKELSSGSIKLLYSSPISNTQIILGKFFSMAVYAALLMAMLLIYIVIAGCVIENFEWAWVLTGLLGLFLLICTYMAVGIFVSSLTTYQILAAVGTFMILMVLSMVGQWGQQYDIVREITYWLSINGRASTFIDGMLCSEDILYFPVITALFLSLTIIRLNAVRQKQRVLKTLKQYGTVALLVCVVAIVSSHPMMRCYYDTTINKINTLTPNSQEIIKQATGGMTITSYVNVADMKYNLYAYPNFIFNNRKMFERYVRFKPEIKLKVVYYYADPSGKNTTEATWNYAKIQCKNTGLDTAMLKTKEEIDQMVDLSGEDYTFIRQIVRDNGQKEWLRAYNFGAPSPSEAEISVALKRLVMKLPRIGFVQGHRERDIHTEVPQGYSFIGNQKKVSFSAWNQGFDVTEVSLQQPVPEDVDLLVIADMRSELLPNEEEKLQEYIDRGRSLFILCDPDHREAQNPMLRKFLGLELTPTLVGEDIRFEKKLQPNELGCILTKEMREKMFHITEAVVMPTCSGIEQIENKGFEIHPFLTSDTLGLYWTELETTDFEDDTVKFNPAAGEISKQFITLAGLTRTVNGKEQRILVSGDADCVANNEFFMKRFIRCGNQNLFLGASYWLSHGRAPIDVRRPSPVDNHVMLSRTENQVIKIMIIWVLPIFLLCLGVFVWLRRRGR